MKKDPIAEPKHIAKKTIVSSTEPINIVYD